jgi:hypothetical protein
MEWKISRRSIGLGVYEITSLSAYYDNQITLQNKTLGTKSGVYILDHTPLGGGISADVIWGKNMKRGREKGGKCKRKRKKGKQKGRKVKKIRKEEVKG